jgi:Tfp pilus assembly protein PilX
MALLGVFLVILMLTVLGIAGLTMTGLENRMAGFAGTSDAVTAAAESCTGTAANVITQAILLGSVPASYVVGGAGATNPVVPTNAENAGSPPTLSQEIQGAPGAENNPDFALGAGASPDLQFNVGPMAVAGDIDRLYARYKSGGQIEFGADASNQEILYRVDCQAQNVATGITSRVTVGYACLIISKDTCQKKFL